MIIKAKTYFSGFYVGHGVPTTRPIARLLKGPTCFGLLDSLACMQTDSVKSVYNLAWELEMFVLSLSLSSYKQQSLFLQYDKLFHAF